MLQKSNTRFLLPVLPYLLIFCRRRRRLTLHNFILLLFLTTVIESFPFSPSYIYMVGLPWGKESNTWNFGSIIDQNCISPCVLFSFIMELFQVFSVPHQKSHSKRLAVSRVSIKRIYQSIYRVISRVALLPSERFIIFIPCVFVLGIIPQPTSFGISYVSSG